MHPSVSTDGSDDDVEIVRLVRDRQGLGLRMLLERYGSITQRAVKKALGNTLDDAELDEAMSTASYNAWRAIDTYDLSKGTLRAWFFAIARNAGRTILRDRQQRQWEPRGDAMALLPAAPIEIDPEATDAGAATQAGEQSPFLAALRSCIERLPSLQRSIIEADLRTGDVADAAELASELYTSKNSIYVSRNTARKTLRRTLSEMGCHLGKRDQAWT